MERKLPASPTSTLRWTSNPNLMVTGRTHRTTASVYTDMVEPLQYCSYVVLKRIPSMFTEAMTSGVQDYDISQSVPHKGTL